MGLELPYPSPVASAHHPEPQGARVQGSGWGRAVHGHGDRAPGLPGWALSCSGSPGCAGGSRQDLAAGGITADSVVPTWQDSSGAAGHSGAAFLVQGPGLGGHQECGC